MFGFIKSLFDSQYHTTYAVDRFKAWWEHHGSDEFSGNKQLALLQWASSPVRGMPDWDDAACEILKEWASQ